MKNVVAAALLILILKIVLQQKKVLGICLITLLLKV
nr:MAG TPA: hypothetical protein [Bacteriophage sp.]